MEIFIDDISNIPYLGAGRKSRKKGGKGKSERPIDGHIAISCHSINLVLVSINLEANALQGKDMDGKEHQAFCCEWPGLIAFF